MRPASVAERHEIGAVHEDFAVAVGKIFLPFRIARGAAVQAIDREDFAALARDESDAPERALGEKEVARRGVMAVLGPFAEERFQPLERERAAVARPASAPPPPALARRRAPRWSWRT